MVEITTLEDLKNFGDIIELPGFGDKKIIVKVRKPDIMMMMIDGKIPNPLLEAALSVTQSGKIDLYKNKSNDEENDEIDIEKTKKWINYLRAIAQEALISPSYKDFEIAGIPLNISQLSAIYKYVTEDANSLKSFRSE